MTFVGETTYLENHNFMLFNNTFLEKDTDFEGHIYFHTTTGEFINGWSMIDGKVSGKIEPVDGALDRGFKLRDRICSGVAVYQLFSECDGWIVYGETMEGIIIMDVDVNCEISSQYVGSVINCTDVEMVIHCHHLEEVLMKKK